MFPYSSLDRDHVKRKGKIWKTIAAGAITGACVALSGISTSFFPRIAPVLIPAAAAALTSLSLLVGGGAIASTLVATSAFLSSSAGFELTSTGLLAGGSWYGG